jgi:hypothetical protein
MLNARETFAPILELGGFGDSVRAVSANDFSGESTVIYPLISRELL